MSARTARAQDEPHGIKRSGVELGVRAFFAIPFGEAQVDRDLSDIIAWQVPLELDIGYREEHTTLGLYVGYGFAKAGTVLDSDCSTPGLSCSAHSIRAGVQILYHFAPKRPIGGWFSAGVGYEQIAFGVDAEGVDAHLTGRYMGIESSVQAGLDFRTQSGIGLGPFIGLLPGRYLDNGLDCSGRDCPALPGVSIDTANHNWLVIGVRGALLL